MMEDVEFGFNGFWDLDELVFVVGEEFVGGVEVRGGRFVNEIIFIDFEEFEVCFVDGFVVRGIISCKVI